VPADKLRMKSKLKIIIVNSYVLDKSVPQRDLCIEGLVPDASSVQRSGFWEVTKS
jgi:hypothetical protein